MLIGECQTGENVEAIYHIDIGRITMLETFAVTELKEGIIVNHEKWEGLFDLITDHFGSSGHFGLICNRIHPISVVPTELHMIAHFFQSEPKIAIVNYTTVGSMSAEFEKRFWPFPISLFTELEPAVAWMHATLKSAC